MNDLTEMNNEKTMSSLEIAELTGKDHRNVTRDIKCMLTELEIDTAKFEHIYKDSMNREQKCYNLPKHESLVLVSGYSTKLRSAIIKRWQELEAPPKFVPMTLEDSLKLNLTQLKQLEVANKTIDTLTANLEDCNTTKLAKTLGVSATKLNKWMKSKGIKFKNMDMPIAKYALWFNVVMITNSVTGYSANQCLITALGQREISKLWSDEA